MRRLNRTNVQSHYDLYIRISNMAQALRLQYTKMPDEIKAKVKHLENIAESHRVASMFQNSFIRK